MNRITKISAPEDFAIEVMREDLRDQRWRRHRSMLFALTLLVLTVGLDPRLYPWLLALRGL